MEKQLDKSIDRSREREREREGERERVFFYCQFTLWMQIDKAVNEKLVVDSLPNIAKGYM